MDNHKNNHKPGEDQHLKPRLGSLCEDLDQGACITFEKLK